MGGYKETRDTAKQPPPLTRRMGNSPPRRRRVSPELRQILGLGDDPYNRLPWGQKKESKSKSRQVKTLPACTADLFPFGCEENLGFRLQGIGFGRTSARRRPQCLAGGKARFPGSRCVPMPCSVAHDPQFAPEQPPPRTFGVNQPQNRLREGDPLAPI